MASTQDAARERVERDGADVAGIVYMTTHQTAGRGRHGRTWYAPAGSNLSVTCIARPMPLAELWQVAFVAAVAVADAVTQIVPNVSTRLRFPNDVLLASQKVSGILIETATGADVPSGFAMPLIGIGVNVRGNVAAMPPDVAVRATTLQAVTGMEITVGRVGATVFSALTHRWNEWRVGDGIASTLAAWHNYHDADARRTFTIRGEPMSCRVLSVTESGDVTLELPDGSRETLPDAHVLL